jgi:hypothetical protein
VPRIESRRLGRVNRYARLSAISRYAGIVRSECSRTRPVVTVKNPQSAALPIAPESDIGLGFLASDRQMIRSKRQKGRWRRPRKRKGAHTGAGAPCPRRGCDLRGARDGPQAYEGSIPCPSVIRQHDGSAQAQDCRDDSRREDARKTGEAGRVGAGIGRRFTLVRARAPPLSSSTEKTKRVGGAGAETTRGSQDRFKGQPQERQHSAVEIGTRDRLPPANDSRASRRVRINFAFVILWYRLVVEHVDARRAHVH